MSEFNRFLLGPATAYALAVQQGFEGTLDEWLASLHGEQGPQGDTGPVGPPGPQGNPGPALAVTNTAAVGQTIRVSAVDDAGKPTEWEAVEFPAGGDCSLELLDRTEIYTEDNVSAIEYDNLQGYDEIVILVYCGYVSTGTKVAAKIILNDDLEIEKDWYEFQTSGGRYNFLRFKRINGSCYEFFAHHSGVGRLVGAFHALGARDLVYHNYENINKVTISLNAALETDGSKRPCVAYFFAR